jgi:hypothetical protein
MTVTGREERLKFLFSRRKVIAHHEFAKAWKAWKMAIERNKW